jgi:hypothetical protein
LYRKGGENTSRNLQKSDANGKDGDEECTVRRNRNELEREEGKYERN